MLYQIEHIVLMCTLQDRENMHVNVVST